MNSRQEVDQLLGQWFRLTQAEAGAIQSASWPSVGEIQSAKAELQKSLTRALKQWTAENGRRSMPADHPFHADVSRLISLETRNAELVAVQMRRAQLEKEMRAEGLRNLRRLRRSYGNKSAKTWEACS